jgi:hypothetical protein
MIEWLKPFGRRPAGRPKNRWIDGVLRDMEVLQVKNLKELTRNRKEWNKLVELGQNPPRVVVLQKKKKK